MSAFPANVQHRENGFAWTAPIFVVGSTLSGTTLLYHMLLSSGSFACFFGEPAVFDLLVLKFGDLSVARNRERLMHNWIGSRMRRASGHDEKFIRSKVFNECRSNADFLRILMQAVASSQGVQRWAVWGPDNLLYMRTIKAQMPDARFIHMIRDGRDVAISMHKEDWIRPLPWDRSQRMLVAALHWLSKVNHGRKRGKRFAPDYLEVRFEDLLAEREETLLRTSAFVGYDLNLDHLQKNPLGTLRVPIALSVLIRSKIVRWGVGEHSSPHTRLNCWNPCSAPRCLSWVMKVSKRELKTCGVATRIGKAMYPVYFEAKLRCKGNAPPGRFVDTSWLRLEQQVS